MVDTQQALRRFAGALVAASALLPAQDPSVSFRYDILPRLARAGCSAAECHGGATGRGGLKLSLFGSDPRADWVALTQESDARRVDYRRPERSLLLRKPTRLMKHGGGRVITPDDPTYGAIRRWIEAGTPIDEAKLEALWFAPSDDSRVRIMARLESDGRQVERDVTHLAVLRSTNESVATVSPSGEVQLLGRGQSQITARFGHLTVGQRVGRPFGTPRALESGTTIDEAWRASLGRLGLEPAPAAAPERLLRRLYLDAVGRLPSPAEQRAFADGDRLRATVRHLLDTEEFTAVWSERLAAEFEVPDLRTEPARFVGRNRQARAHIRRALAKGVPWDQLATQLLRPGGIMSNWTADPLDRAEWFGRAVLGVRIGCARCHDHPLDRWRKSEHQQFAALFADPRPDAERGMTMGLLFDPETGQAVTRRTLPFPGSTPGDDLSAFVQSDGMRRVLARNLGNRVIAVLFGRGLVDATDDHRGSNPAALELLMERMTSVVLRHDFDVRPILEDLLTSAFYASETAAEDDPVAVRFFARREVRKMDETTFQRSLAAALGTPVPPLPSAPASPLAEQLERWNGDRIPEALKGSEADAIFDFVAPDRRLDAIWRLLLCRLPTAAERQALDPAAATGDRTEWRRLVHAIILSREFTSIR